MKTIGVGDFKASPKAIKYVNQVLKSGRLSYGPFTRRFEKEFAGLHDCEHGIFCNSGTSALQIALQALKEKHGWADGDEVIVPAVTFVATANIVLHNRMTPVFVDVDPVNFNLDVSKLGSAITQKTRAIIPVHMMGKPADMLSILNWAKEYDLKIIEDSCETMFGEVGFQSVGSVGDVGCFSTYLAHYIVTGIGGICTTNDDDLAVRMRSLMNHGRDGIYLNIDDDDRASGDKRVEIMEKRFSFTSVGHRFRATEMEAALGVAQLEEWEKIVRARQENGARLMCGLKDIAEYIQLPDPRGHMFMMFPILVKDESKVYLCKFLEDRGIETRDIPTVINQPIYKGVAGDFPVTRSVIKGGLYVGCTQYLNNRDIDRMVEVIHQYFKGRK